MGNQAEGSSRTRAISIDTSKVEANISQGKRARLAEVEQPEQKPESPKNGTHPEIAK